jgi:Fe-S-cluster containining protein
MVLPVSMPIQKSLMMDWLDARGCEVVAKTDDTLYVKIDYPCPNLTKSENGFGCDIYSSRPEGCRIFDGRNYEFLDCVWKEERYVILEKAFHGGGPSRGGLRIKSSKVYSSDQKKRLAKRKSIEKKEEKRENIAAYGSDIDKESE